MNNDEKVTCKEFQTEVFLYAKNDLPADKMAFWKDHLANCSECASEMNFVVKLNGVLKEKTLVDIEDSIFDKMIEKAALKRNRFQNIFQSGLRYNENKSFYGKAALAGVLATAAIVISVITHQSIPVKNIPNNILDWEGTKITSQIDDLKTRIQMIGEDKWDKEILQIDQRLEKLEKRSDKFSFN
jgi:hypothetical protein